MTDNDIIKALGGISYGGHSCTKCKYKITKGEDRCGLKGCKIARNALDLINRQKAEIERLQKKGEWEYIDDIMITVCSECGNRPIVNEFGNEVLSDYCAHCGAKLKGE